MTSIELVRRSALQNHLQQVLRPGCFYSLPAAAATCRGLQKSGPGLPSSAGPSVPLGPLMDLEPDGGEDLPQIDAAALTSSDVYLRVVCPRPGALKTVPLGAADAQTHKLDKRALCVTFHSTIMKAGQLAVSIDPQACPGMPNPLALLSAHVADFDLLQQRFLSWGLCEAITVSLEGEACLPEVIKRFGTESVGTRASFSFRLPIQLSGCVFV
jgi:hypothetical protein